MSQAWRNRAKSDFMEVFSRRSCPLMQVDLGSIPAGSDILSAQLVLATDPRYTKATADPAYKPTLIVAEACNRPWVETEVNGLEYAKGKFWTDFASQSWGEDGDCGAIYLSYGPGNGNANAWDFTHAVRYWTEGKHTNHGFIISSQGKYVHALSIFTYRCKDMKKRPCVAVIYEPEEKA